MFLPGLAITSEKKDDVVAGVGAFRILDSHQAFVLIPAVKKGIVGFGTA